MTYLVMESHLSYSVVMDEAGRFIKAANLNYDVGQTVDNVVPLNVPKKTVAPLRIISVAAGIAACLMLVFYMYWNSFMTPIASIYLTINPEVRMEINRDDHVVGLTGQNEDGIALIDGYSYRGRSIGQVADDLVDRAIAMGLLSDGGKVTVSLDSPDDTWFQKTGIALRQSLTDHLSGRMSVTIEVKQYGQQEKSADTPRPAPSQGAPSQTPPPQTAPPPTASPTPIPATQPPAPTAPPTAAPPTLPPADHESNYGDSDYNPPVTDYNDDDPDSNYGNNGDSGYGDSGYGDSGYDDD